MLLLDVVKIIHEGTEGNLDLIMISLINLVAGLLHCFLLDHAYKYTHTRYVYVYSKK